MLFFSNCDFANIFLLPGIVSTGAVPANNNGDWVSYNPRDYFGTGIPITIQPGDSAPINGLPKTQQQTQPQHFWQKPGCADALWEFGAGVAGTAITAGAIGAAIYMGPEMFEGIEGAATLLHIAPVGAPGLMMMGDGGYKASQTCF